MSYRNVLLKSGDSSFDLDATERARQLRKSRDASSEFGSE